MITHPIAVFAMEPSSSGSANLSALEERANDLIIEKMERWEKSDIAEGPEKTALLNAVEDGNAVTNVTDLFKTIQELKTEKECPNKDSPLTNTALNEVKDYQSHVQDGRGGGKPSNREAAPCREK